MLPESIGPCAFGIKMGLVHQGSDLISEIAEAIIPVDGAGLLSDSDVLCVTESVVARSQNNYITTQMLAAELREKLSLPDRGKIGVVFPITSRNRFALVLEGIAMSVPGGEVIVQLSYPNDEVGNRIVPAEVAEVIAGRTGGCFTPEDFEEKYVHPLTGMDYTCLYSDIIESAGAKARIVLCNTPENILEYAPDAVIASDIHTREETKKKILAHFENVITLKEIFNTPAHGAWSEWGLLGSNMASAGKLKLAPHEGDMFVRKLQERILKKFGKKVEAIIYGDGAYKDPSSGIYELADPCAAFGVTSGITDLLRTGIKLKYMVDMYQGQGRSEKDIRKMLDEEIRKERGLSSNESEGTTPRRMEDVLASLADLVSGSADAGTPIVLAKGFLR